MERTKKRPLGAHTNHTASYRRSKLSYADVVRKKTCKTISQHEKKQTEFKEQQRTSNRETDIRVTPRDKEIAWLKDCLVGECFSLEQVAILQDRWRME
ncbi:hypothetical protein Ancab_021648, partial [Ancistrocladus abbreviatus]